MKTPKFVMLIYEDHSCKGYNWAAFKKTMAVAAQNYAKKVKSHEKNPN